MVKSFRKVLAVTIAVAMLLSTGIVGMVAIAEGDNGPVAATGLLMWDDFVRHDLEAGFQEWYEAFRAPFDYDGAVLNWLMSQSQVIDGSWAEDFANQNNSGWDSSYGWWGGISPAITFVENWLAEWLYQTTGGTTWAADDQIDWLDPLAVGETSWLTNAYFIWQVWENNESARDDMRAANRHWVNVVWPDLWASLDLTQLEYEWYNPPFTQGTALLNEYLQDWFISIDWVLEFTEYEPGQWWQHFWRNSGMRSWISIWVDKWFEETADGPWHDEDIKAWMDTFDFRYDIPATGDWGQSGPWNFLTERTEEFIDAWVETWNEEFADIADVIEGWAYDWYNRPRPTRDDLLEVWTNTSWGHMGRFAGFDIVYDYQILSPLVRGIPTGSTTGWSGGWTFPEGTPARMRAFDGNENRDGPMVYGDLIISETNVIGNTLHTSISYGEAPAFRLFDNSANSPLRPFMNNFPNIPGGPQLGNVDAELWFSIPMRFTHTASPGENDGAWIAFGTTNAQANNVDNFHLAPKLAVGFRQINIWGSGTTRDSEHWWGFASTSANNNINNNTATAQHEFFDTTISDSLNETVLVVIHLYLREGNYADVATVYFNPTRDSLGTNTPEVYEDGDIQTFTFAPRSDAWIVHAGGGGGWWETGKFRADSIMIGSTWGRMEFGDIRIGTSFAYVTPTSGEECDCGDCEECFIPCCDECCLGYGDCEDPCVCICGNLSNIATLATLTSNVGTWTPEVFNPEVFAYDVAVEHNFTTITFEYTTTCLDAYDVDIYGPATLDVGPNEFIITVTAEDETTTEVYTITVTRANDPGPDPVDVGIVAANGYVTGLNFSPLPLTNGTAIVILAIFDGDDLIEVVETFNSVNVVNHPVNANYRFIALTNTAFALTGTQELRAFIWNDFLGIRPASRVLNTIVTP